MMKGYLALNPLNVNKPPFGNWTRFLSEARPKAQAGECCEFCSVGLSETHSHVVNVESRAILCACRACYLLFTAEGSGSGKFKAVPQRHFSVDRPILTLSQWESFQIPVGLAFVFWNSTLCRMMAFYPSPAGAMESQLSPDVWNEIVRENPVFQTLLPDVEAVIILKREAGFEGFVVPIDACYELIGRIRLCWKGLDGGEEVWKEIETFFFRIREKSEQADWRPAT